MATPSAASLSLAEAELHELLEAYEELKSAYPYLDYGDPLERKALDPVAVSLRALKDRLDVHRAGMPHWQRDIEQQRSDVDELTRQLAALSTAASPEQARAKKEFRDNLRQHVEQELASLRKEHGKLLRERQAANEALSGLKSKLEEVAERIAATRKETESLGREAERLQQELGAADVKLDMKARERTRQEKRLNGLLQEREDLKADLRDLPAYFVEQRLSYSKEQFAESLAARKAKMQQSEEVNERLRSEKQTLADILKVHESDFVGQQVALVMGMVADEKSDRQAGERKIEEARRQMDVQREKLSKLDNSTSARQRNIEAKRAQLAALQRQLDAEEVAP